MYHIMFEMKLISLFKASSTTNRRNNQGFYLFYYITITFKWFLPEIWAASSFKMKFVKLYTSNCYLEPSIRLQRKKFHKGEMFSLT